MEIVHAIEKQHNEIADEDGGEYEEQQILRSAGRSHLQVNNLADLSLKLNKQFSCFYLLL